VSAPPGSPEPDARVLSPTGIDIIGIRAANPGPLSLSGTNSWIVGRDPAWLIDPGPALEEHLAALAGELERRGGLGGIAVTHDHPDHVEALPEMRRRYPGGPIAGARGEVDVAVAGGERVGPLEAVAVPGHAPDHIVYLFATAGMTGDAVLGEGSVFISPDPGALAAYLAALRRLSDLGLAVLCPGHGPPVRDPARKFDEYIAHRLEREQRLLAVLASGKRTVQELLDEVWSDTPEELRPAAAWTLAAHLDKLADEGRLPDGVETPPLNV